MKNTYNSTGTTKVCTVMAVDIVRKVCKCMSDSGESLADVRWVVPMGGSDGTGVSVHPLENSRVLIDTSSGYPYIIGAIHSDSTRDVRRTNIGRQDVDETDIADYSTVDIGDLVRGPDTPRDQRVGDNVITSDGGGLMGLLSSGTAFIKSSPLAQMLFSRFGDLVRIVSRNFEHFTDVDSTYKTSNRGKIFALREVFRTPTRSREEKPSFVQYQGDVAWGETVGKAYAKYTTDTYPTEIKVAEDADKILKEYTLGDDDVITSTRTLSIAGATHLSIDAPEKSTIQDANHQELKKVVTGGDKTNWWMNETQFHWDCADVIKIEGNKDGVVISADTGVVISLNKSGVLDINTTGKCTMTYGAGLDMNVTGETNITSTGNLNMSAPMINLN